MQSSPNLRGHTLYRVFRADAVDAGHEAQEITSGTHRIDLTEGTGSNIQPVEVETLTHSLPKPPPNQLDAGIQCGRGVSVVVDHEVLDSSLQIEIKNLPDVTISELRDEPEKRNPLGSGKSIKEIF